MGADGSGHDIGLDPRIPAMGKWEMLGSENDVMMKGRRERMERSGDKDEGEEAGGSNKLRKHCKG